jgi:hypothetical protein
MCDVHLCEDAIRRIYEMGPVALIVVPGALVDHLLTCDECIDKLAGMIALAAVPPISEKVM